MDDMDIVIPSSPPSLKRKRKPRKQANPTKRILQGHKLVFGCSEKCECVYCSYKALKLPGDCVGVILDFLPTWPKRMTPAKYGLLLGNDLKTCEKDSYWWTGVVRKDNKLDTLQQGAFVRYTVGLQKRTKHPFLEALLSGNIRSLPWSMDEEGTWDVVPNAAREVTAENQDRVNGLIFLQVERRRLYTHLFKLELQLERVEEADGSFQLVPMSWRFTVRPHWKYICGRRSMGGISPTSHTARLFNTPHDLQKVTVGDLLYNFKQLQNGIISDDEAWLSPSVVNLQVAMGQGSWLPYGSFLESSHLCRSRVLEQYYHVGITESEYEKCPGFVDKITQFSKEYDISIPLMECILEAKGSNGRPMLVCRPYSLKNGLLSNACRSDHIREEFLVHDRKQDIFYI